MFDGNTFTLSSEDNIKMKTLMEKYNVYFSGYQTLQTKNPLAFIRRVYKPSIQVCIVKFWGTHLLIDMVYDEYFSGITKHIFHPEICLIKCLVPYTEFIDSERNSDWIVDVCRFILSDSLKNPKLIILEGIFHYEDCKRHYLRIISILDTLEKLTIST